jgi:dihydrofolate synthase / folylpolyglutamate synthase
MVSVSLADHLDRQQRVHGTGIDLTLERVREVARRLDLLRPRATVVTVAGTNGKGSTVAYTAGILLAQGRRVGSFTSPHLLRYNERIRIDGREAQDAELVAAFEAIDAARAEITLTFFEYNALAALWVFREREVDHAVLEVGLGGRLDAVNIIDADAAIVCSIGLDHKDWLGDDVEGIGREKAGVFRRDRIAVVADPAMTPSVEAEAVRLGARRLVAQRDYRFAPDGNGFRFEMPGLSLRLPRPALRGDVQLANASASIAALQALGTAGTLREEAVARALTDVRLPGRFQVIPGPVEWILDVAHNEPAAAVLAANLQATRGPGRTWVVAGILGDKDIAAIARELAPVTDEWILCGIDDPRGLTAEQLAARSPVFAGAILATDIAAGVAIAKARALPGDRVVLCGSFLAVAPGLAALGLY